jgi:hypothetical protein
MRFWRPRVGALFCTLFSFCAIDIFLIVPNLLRLLVASVAQLVEQLTLNFGRLFLPFYLTLSHLVKPLFSGLHPYLFLSEFI